MNEITMPVTPEAKWIEPTSRRITYQICGADVEGPINLPVSYLCPECRYRLMRVLYGEDGHV